MNGNYVCCVSVGISNTLCFHPKSIWISFILSVIKQLPHFSSVTYCLYIGWKQRLPLSLFLHISASESELVSGKGHNASKVQTDVWVHVYICWTFLYLCLLSELAFLYVCKGQLGSTWQWVYEFEWMNEWMNTHLRAKHVSVCSAYSFRGRSLKTNSENRTLR